MDRSLLIFIMLISISAGLTAAAITVPTNLIPSFVKLPIVFIAVIIDVLAFGSRYYLFLLLPIAQQKTNKIILSNEPPYRISAAGDTVLHMLDGSVVATIYINIPYYRSATEMSADEKLEFARQVGRLIGMRPDPVRFTTALYTMDKANYISAIRSQITDAEADRTSAAGSNNNAAMAKAEGEIEMWRNVLSHITREDSLEMATFASVSSNGTDEIEATELARQKAREIISAVGANFGISATLVTGESLRKMVEPEYLIPYETVHEKIEEQIREEVV